MICGQEPLEDYSVPFVWGCGVCENHAVVYGREKNVRGSVGVCVLHKKINPRRCDDFVRAKDLTVMKILWEPQAKVVVTVPGFVEGGG